MRQDCDELLVERPQLTVNFPESGQWQIVSADPVFLRWAAEQEVQP
ncbi:hypothetical protein ROT00_07125 [Agromyces mediolanus]